MARKIRSQKTAEERREEAERLQKELAQQVESMRDSDQWMNYHKVVSQFHSYSLNNLFMIMIQNPEAAQVAGFRKWMNIGRVVRKGDKTIKIFGYALRKLSQEEIDRIGDQIDSYRTNSNGDPVVAYFPLWSVFDISQTDPVDPDDDAFPSADAFARRLEDQDHLGIFQAAEGFLTERGYRVERTSIAG